MFIFCCLAYINVNFWLFGLYKCSFLVISRIFNTKVGNYVFKMNYTNSSALLDLKPLHNVLNCLYERNFDEENNHQT